MISKIHNFLTKIQKSDEATKKFWVAIFSGTTMTIVIALWITYMKTTLPSVAQSEKSVPKNKTEESSRVSELKEIFSAGWQSITANIKDKIGTQRNIYVNASERNFILDNLEKIPETKIP